MGKIQRIQYHGRELLPVKMDLVFKALLTADGDMELLASLLSCILELDITAGDVAVTNTELSPKHEEGKPTSVDVRVKLRDGKHINVEIQVENESNMASRSIFYLARLYVDQMKPRMGFHDIRPTIAINILDFNYLPFDEYHSIYRMKNIKNCHQLTDVFQIDFIELKKISKESLSSLKDLWVQFIAADSEEMLDMLSKEDPIMDKALQKLCYISADDKLRYELDMRHKTETDYWSAMSTNYRKGEAAGRAEGLAKVEAEVQTAKRDIARKLKGLNTMSAYEIAKVSGLPTEEIKDL